MGRVLFADQGGAGEEDMNDRQRVEIMLPAQIMLGVLLAGASDQECDDFKIAKEAFIEASDEAVRDLMPEKRASIIRRMFRVNLEVSAPYQKENARVDKMGLIAFYWLRALVDQDYLILHEGSAMQRGMDIMMPALEHAANIEKLDASAQKNARKFLAHLQRLGYYPGVKEP